MGRILVVDDDPQILRIIKRKLAKSFEEIATTSSPEEAIRLCENVDAVLIDQKMPQISGIELMALVRKENPDLPVVIMTAFGSIEEAIESVKKGAFHYITKPINFEELNSILGRAIENKKLKEKVKSLEGFLGLDVIAESEAMREVINLARKVAPFDTPVLITGESGVGKEVLARLIHKHSRRAGSPFVPINCSAIPETLLEAELFGYKKGSFSGAYGDKKGIIEEAEGGTLFLDEIGDLPVSLQPKLLRLLQEREIKPIGYTRPKKVDVRIICATNRDLTRMVEEGSFREDLFYRINVIHIEIPPLRKRKEDILPLAYLFIRKSAEKFGMEIKELSERAKNELLSREWKGNVRELENAIERSFILAEGGVIEKIHSEGQSESKSYTGVGTFDEEKAEFERNYLMRLMNLTGWNISEASRISGKTRAQIYRMLKRHKIR